jgi:hypothetical protein
VVINVDAQQRRFPIWLRAVRVDYGGQQFVISWAKPFPEAAPFKLPEQQAQCFKLLGEGKTPKEIAAHLHVSLSTVNTHLNRVKDAIAKAQSTENNKTTAALIDIAHLAVRCREAGWSPTLRINAPVEMRT